MPQLTLNELANLVQGINSQADLNARAAAITGLKTSLSADRKTALADASASLTQSQNEQLEFLRAYKRGKDLYTAQTELLSAEIPKRVQSDVDTTRRQYEINEYTYNQKMSVLYALQVSYIAILVCAVLAAVVGLIGKGMALILAGIVTVVAAGLIGYQIYYNRKMRDRSEWTRRYFTLDPTAGAPAPTPTPEPTCPTVLSNPTP